MALGKCPALVGRDEFKGLRLRPAELGGLLLPGRKQRRPWNVLLVWSGLQRDSFGGPRAVFAMLIESLLHGPPPF